jgi:hypothetical protein
MPRSVPARAAEACGAYGEPKTRRRCVKATAVGEETDAGRQNFSAAAAAAGLAAAVDWLDGGVGEQRPADGTPASIKNNDTDDEALPTRKINGAAADSSPRTHCWATEYRRCTCMPNAYVGAGESDGGVSGACLLLSPSLSFYLYHAGWHIMGTSKHGCDLAAGLRQMLPCAAGKRRRFLPFLSYHFIFFLYASGFCIRFFFLFWN